MSLLIDSTVVNLFPASPTNHVVHIEKFPTLSFTVQEVNLPGITAPTVKINNPRGVFHHAPTKMFFDALTVKFLVDETLAGYKEVYDWMTGVTGNNEDVTAGEYYAQLKQQRATPIASTATVVQSSIGLTIVNANKVPIIRVLFFNAQPVALSEIAFSTTIDAQTAMTATCTFEYDSFHFVNLRP